MKADEAKAALRRLIEQGKYLCEISMIAKRGRQSLRGDGTYGKKFHAGAVAISATLAKLQPTFASLNDEGTAKGCELVRRSCETLKNPDADRPTRSAAFA